MYYPREKEKVKYWKWDEKITFVIKDEGTVLVSIIINNTFQFKGLFKFFQINYAEQANNFINYFNKICVKPFFHWFSRSRDRIIGSHPVSMIDT